MFYWKHTTVRWAGEEKLCLQPLIVKAETAEEANEIMLDIAKDWPEEQSLETFLELPRVADTYEQALENAMEELNKKLQKKKQRAMV